MSVSELYRFLITAVVPRPIAFVSTRSVDGHMNVAPFSFFNAITSEPPIVMLAINDRADDPKDTLRNIRETREFVINVVHGPMLEAMVRTAGDWPRDTSEFEVAGLTPVASVRVAAPAVQESPIHLECVLHRELEVGRSFVVFGEVVFASVDDAMLTDGRVDPVKLAPVGRLGGELYSLTTEVVKVPRPRVSRAGGEVQG
ncbi:MAG: flavin reductase family protein [Candidatus Eisenbacteria bacterium]